MHICRKVVLTSSAFLLSISRAFNQEQKKLSKHSRARHNDMCLQGMIKTFKIVFFYKFHLMLHYFTTRNAAVCRMKTFIFTHICSFTISFQFSVLSLFIIIVSFFHSLSFSEEFPMHCVLE